MQPHLWQFNSINMAKGVKERPLAFIKDLNCVLVGIEVKACTYTAIIRKDLYGLAFIAPELSAKGFVHCVILPFVIFYAAKFPLIYIYVRMSFCVHNI